MFFEDLKNHAQQELHQMRHYYMGVEHLFIALLGMESSITTRYLRTQGYTANYVTEMIRRKVGKGSKQRNWAGIIQSPRIERVIRYAEHLAREEGYPEPNERHLLEAILPEEDCMPVMVLQKLNIDIEDFLRFARTSPGTGQLRLQVNVQCPAEIKMNDDQRLVIQRMFSKYSTVRIERRLTGGYTDAALYVVTPINHDGWRDASVVVKIDHTDVIQDESTRYNQIVRDTLPGTSARLIDRPVFLDNRPIGAIKYTLVGSETDQLPRDLRGMLDQWSLQEIGEWLREKLYPTFGKIWWEQRSPYRFVAWQEYDRLFPSILTLEYVPREQIPANAYTLRAPVNRLRLQGLEYGDTVVIENFSIRKIIHSEKMLQLAMGAGSNSELAYKIEIRGVDLDSDTYYRGEVVDSIAGRIWSTRTENLKQALRALEPDFDIESGYVPYSPELDKRFPNPVMHYEQLMDLHINGTMSKIHGDMHLGNIMVGPNDTPFLIDFEKTREGHTIFDWVSLELSILIDVVMPRMGESWKDARRAVEYLQAINSGKPIPTKDPALKEAFELVADLRKIAGLCLAEPGHWTEYYVALALSSLRAVMWRYSHQREEKQPAKRLLFLVAGLAMNELRVSQSNGVADTQYPDDETDLFN